MLTTALNYSYTEILKTNSGYPLRQFAGFFMPTWRMIAENILNIGRPLFGFSESATSSSLKWYLKRIGVKMTNSISVYDFQQNQIRTTVIDGNPYFCLTDCCKCLNIAQTRDVVSRLKGVVKTDTLTNGGKQSLNYINEPNLYRLIFRSNKPQAQAFADWVYSEVLPSIRKTGQYSVTDKPVIVAEHTRALPSGKKEIVLSEKAKQEIGGIVKAVLSSILKQDDFDRAFDKALSNALMAQNKELLQKNKMLQKRLSDIQKLVA